MKRYFAALVVLVALAMPATAQYETRDQIVSDHISDLNYPNWVVRHEAVYKLAWFADGYPQYQYEVTNALIERIRRDSDWRVRQAAAIALCRFSVPQDFRKPAVDSLIDALQNDPHEGVRESAANTLGKLGDARAIDPLIEALKNDTNEIVRGTAAESLAILSDAKAIDPLIEALTDESGFVRLVAASSLVRLGRAEYFDQVVLALKDETHKVRRSAARELGEIGDERAVDALIEALEDEDSIVRERAAEALEKIQVGNGDGLVISAESSEKLEKIQAGIHAGELDGLVVALKYGDHDVRVEAAVSLSRIAVRHPSLIGDLRAKAVDPLVEALRDRSNEVRCYAAQALGDIGDPRAVDSLIVALNDESLDVQIFAAEALGKIGDAKAIRPLTYTASRDKYEIVREAAAKALEKIEKTTDRADNVIVSLDEIDEALAWYSKGLALAMQGKSLTQNKMNNFIL